MRFVDSHLHLDGLDGEEVLAYAKAAGALLLGCGVDRRTSLDLVGLADADPKTLCPFVGVHPSEAEREKDLGWLEEASGKAAGIGEIGLDPTYSPVVEGSAQLTAFRRQVRLAERKGKPVQVHSRSAEAECLDTLSQWTTTGVLMHWLENEEALPKAMDRGYFVSFGPALLYSKKLQRVAARADPSLTVLESDAPVTYGPLGGIGGTMLIPSVAFKLSEIWGQRYHLVLETCSANSLRFLGSEKG